MKIRNSCLGPFVILLALATTATIAKENQNNFPGQAWERATPESQGLDPAALKDAIDYLHAHAGGVGADELVVIRNGRLVWEGPAADNVHEIYSATKTFTSTVLGLLVTDGLVDLDAPAVKYLPSLDDEFPEYRHVTLRQLATMTAGYDGALGDGWKFYASDRPKHLEHVLQYLQPGRPLFDPGTSWKYHDPQVHLLGYLLTKVSGKPLEETFRERIAEPIGMKHFAWFNLGTRDGVLFNNPAGTPGINQRGENQGGVCSDARDLARYGLLYLAGGKWDGKTLLDPRFVAQSGSNQVPKNFGPKGGGHYGLYWWTNGERLDGTQPWPQAPPDSYSARGAGRNAIFVIPEWNMVIVRLSPAPGGFDPRKNVPPSVWEEFFVRLAPAVLDPLENRE